MNIDLAQILSQIIAFLITLAVMKRFAWKPLLQILDERQKKIQAEFDDIQARKNELLSQEAEYKRRLDDLEMLARNRIQEAVHEAQKIAREIQQKAKDQADEMLDKTRNELEQNIIKARAQLKNEFVHLTMLATQKITHETMTPSTQEHMLVEFIEKLELK